MEPITIMLLSGGAYVSYKIFARVKRLHSIGKLAAQRRKLAEDYLVKSESLNHTFNTNIVIKNTESVVFFAPCTMYRSIRNGTRFVGGSAGYRATLMKGFSVSAAGLKGYALANFDHETEDGEIIVTDDRIIFSSEGVNFSTRLKELANVVFDGSTVKFDIEKATGADFSIMFHNPKIVKMFSDKFTF